MRYEHWYRPLKEIDIEEKLKLEKEAGRELKSTKELLQLGLFLHEREILKTKAFISGLNLFRFIFRYRKILKALLPLEIQAQNLREQIAYIDKKLAIPK